MRPVPAKIKLNEIESLKSKNATPNRVGMQNVIAD